MTKFSKSTIDRLVDIRRLESGSYELRIQWKGAPRTKNTWESVNDVNMSGLEELLYDLIERKKSKRRVVLELLAKIDPKEERVQLNAIEEISITSCLDNEDSYQSNILPKESNTRSIRSTKPSVKSSCTIKDAEQNYADSKELHNMSFEDSEPKSDMNEISQSRTYRNMLYQIYDHSTSSNVYSPYSYTILKELYVSPALPRFTDDVDSSFLNLKLDTDIKGLGAIQGLQKLHSPCKDIINFRVKISDSETSIIKTIDAVYLYYPKAAYCHLKKKLCQFYLVKLMYAGYMGLASDF